MSIYFVGTEHDAVAGGVSISTDPQNFDSNYSQTALKVTRTISAGVNLVNEFGANSINGWWLQCFYGWDAWADLTPSGGIGWTGMIVKDLLGNVAATAYSTNPNVYAGGNTMRLTVYNAAGNSATIDMGQIMASSDRRTYSLHAFTNSEGKATAEFYMANVLKGTITINQVSPNRACQSCEMYGGFLYGGFGNTTYYDWHGGISEVIVADESTLGMRVKTYRSVADGTHTTWDGTFDNVNNDDVGIEAISTQLTNAAETFLHGQTLNEGTAIRALVVGASIASANPTGAKAILNIGGTLYQQDFKKTLAQGAAPNIAIYETNPATGVSFTAADFNSLEFGVQHA